MLLLWLQCYLKARKQVVRLDNFLLGEINVASGVPQRPHLDLLLFSMCIDDMRQILYSGCFFVDDLKIIF